MACVVSDKALWTVVALIFLWIELCLTWTFHTVFSVPQRKILWALATSLFINQVMWSWWTWFAFASRWIPVKRCLTAWTNSINQVGSVFRTCTSSEINIITQSLRTVFTCWSFYIPIGWVPTLQTGVVVNVRSVGWANASEYSFVEIWAWRTSHANVSVLEEESSSWTGNAFVSIPDWGCIRTPCALVWVDIPILVLLAWVRHAFISFWVPGSWILTSDTSSILNVRSVSRANTLQDTYVKNEASGAWQTLPWRNIEMGSNWTADTIGSIPDRGISRTAQALSNSVVVVCHCWTWDAFFCIFIPVIWRITWNASSAWEVRHILWTFTFHNVKIESQTTWAWQAPLWCLIKVLWWWASKTCWSIPDGYIWRTWCANFEIFIVMSTVGALIASLCIHIPVSGPFTANAKSRTWEVRSCWWTDALESDFVENHISWARETLKWNHIEMSVDWASNAVSSVPNWIGDWAADTALRWFIKVSVDWTCFTNVFGWIPS